jgi:hypothetical protein
MAISSRSNRSLSRFWGIVLAVTFYGFVMAGLLGFPAHKYGKLPSDPAGKGPAQVVSVPHPGTNGLAAVSRGASTAEAAGALPGVAAAPSPQATTTQVAMAGVTSSDSGVSAPPAMVVRSVEPAKAQPDSDAAPAGAEAAPSSQAPPVATVEIAAKPVGAAGLPGWSDLVRRCSDGQWAWQSASCPVPSRRVVWRWVRSCAIHLGRLCLGPHYARVRVAGPDTWSTDALHGDFWR